ncbi:unnamed protein product, partial [Symbiodinium sp. KB8]
YASHSWVLSGAAAPSGHCWTDCANYGLFCPEYCCAPKDGRGNSACWDNTGHFSFQNCCADLRMVTDPEPETASWLADPVDRLLGESPLRALPRTFRAQLSQGQRANC